MAYKHQPLDKTVVTEFVVRVADLNMRTKHLNGSQASRVMPDSDFRQGDKNISVTEHLTLLDIKSVVVVQSFQAFSVTFSNNFGEIITLHCDGLFVFHGKIESLVVKGLLNDFSRITYICA